MQPDFCSVFCLLPPLLPLFLKLHDHHFRYRPVTMWSSFPTNIHCVIGNKRIKLLYFTITFKLWESFTGHTHTLTNTVLEQSPVYAREVHTISSDGLLFGRMTKTNNGTDEQKFKCILIRKKVTFASKPARANLFRVFYQSFMHQFSLKNRTVGPTHIKYTFLEFMVDLVQMAMNFSNGMVSISILNYSVFAINDSLFYAMFSQLKSQLYFAWFIQCIFVNFM